MNCASMISNRNRKWFASALFMCFATLPLAAASIPSRAIANPTVNIAQTQTRPTLRVGSTGGAVSEIQAILTLLGYFDNPVDGKYQATTEAAVQKFQTDVGLNSDGIVGPATWEKLLPTPSTEFTPPDVPETAAADADAETMADEDEADEPIELPTLRQGVSGPAVMRVQDTLKSRGFYDGPVDGIFGPATEAAVMEFQRSKQLAADGVVGPATWQALLQ